MILVYVLEEAGIFMDWTANTVAILLLSASLVFVDPIISSFFPYPDIVFYGLLFLVPGIYYFIVYVVTRNLVLK